MKNPFERTPQEKPPLKDLAVDYLNTQGAIDRVKKDDLSESEQRGTMFGTFDQKEREKDAKRSAEIIRELETRLQALREQGVTSKHLKEAEERGLDYMEAELDGYEEYVRQDEAELTRLEAKPEKDENDLAQIKKLNDRLYGLGGTNEDRRTHGSRTWVDIYATQQRTRFAQQRKELEVKYPWGTPLTEQELKEVGFGVGDSVSMFEGGVGTILNIKRYDIDGGTIMAEVEDKDGKRSFTNVRVLKHS